MEQIIDFKKGSALKRFLATLVDIVITLIVFLNIYSFIVEPIFVKNSSYSSVNQEYNDALVATHLYNYDENMKRISIITSDYDESLTYFYTTYDSIDNYNKLKQDATNLFTFNEETMQYNEIGEEADMERWYASTTYNAIKTIVTNNEEIKNLSKKISNYIMGMSLISIFPATLLTILLPTMLFKHGETLGLKTVGYKVISKKNKPEITYIQRLIRYGMILFVEIVLSFYTFCLPVIASFIMMLLIKDGSSLTDLASFTVIVDGNPNSKIDQSNRISISYPVKQIIEEENEEI